MKDVTDEPLAWQASTSHYRPDNSVLCDRLVLDLFRLAEARGWHHHAMRDVENAPHAEPATGAILRRHGLTLRSTGTAHEKVTTRAELWDGVAAAVAMLHRPHEVSIVVSAGHEDTTSRLVAEIGDTFVPPPPGDDAVVTEAWCQGTRQVIVDELALHAPRWEDIGQNYPGDVRAALDSLHAVSAIDRTGRAVVLHGPPGTGKTTAIRSLLRSWAPWAIGAVIVDPEVLFTSSEYLLATLRPRPDGRWRALIIEETDELLLSDAKLRSGQALSRLLNVADGLLGQGARTFVVLTTNVDRGDLHPALTRPGRCFADIELRPFTPTEARHWLADRTTTTHPAMARPTLADLYATVTSERLVVRTDEPNAGYT